MAEFQDLPWERLKLDEHRDLALSILVRSSLGSERYDKLFKEGIHDPEQTNKSYLIDEIKRLDQLIVQHNVLMISKYSFGKFIDGSRKTKVSDDQILAWIPEILSTSTSPDVLCPHLKPKNQNGTLAQVTHDLTSVERHREDLYGFPKLHDDEPYLISAGSQGVTVMKKGEHGPEYVCDINRL